MDVDISDLERFTMISTSGRNHVTIYMPIPIKVPNDPQNSGNRTYRFANVSILRIENVTLFFISLNFIGKQNCQFEVEHVNFYGHIGSMSAMVSVINVTNSQAMLKDSTFQHNCFIRIQSSAVLQISDCTFFSYNHTVRSAIGVQNSTIRLTGSVSFINNTLGNNYYSSVCGGALSFNSGYFFSEIVPISIFSITEAHVNFSSNTAMSCGGAIYMKCTLMTVYNKVNMTFASNTVSNFYKYIGGGAMYLEQSNFIVKNAVVQFFNNSAKRAAFGGAISQSRSSITIIDYGAIKFLNNTSLSRGGAIFHSDGNTISVDKYSSLLFYNNSAGQGGALYMQLSGNIRVGSDSYVEFSSNTATKYGGAIYVNDQTCLFTFNNYSSKVLFKENLAKEGVGMHIYGASVKSISCMQDLCEKKIVSYTPSLNNSLSPVSSNPKRICLCDLNGKPQCAEFSSIFVNWHKLYSGESFNISVVVVGYDFGVTTGTVYAGFALSQEHSKQLISLYPGQSHQLIGNNGHIQCSNVSYNLYSLTNNTQETLHRTLFLHTSDIEVKNMFSNEHYVIDMINLYEESKHACANIDLLTIPVFINITLLGGCPPGFSLALQDQFYGCNCYPVLQSNHFKCFIVNNVGYFQWNSTMWVNATFSKFNKSKSDGILLARYCPLNFCKSGEKVINLGRDPNAQCVNNHAGVLCGGCENNYSLAIGSARCIVCSDDSHLLLLMFFAAGGFLLVIFILVSNLTVTQGLINGLILYANILWAYKDIIFPVKQPLMIHMLQIFIAWLNLDFGIETCLVVGLTAYWKTWLQFLFPLYIWLIAGVIIIVCRYSSRLTNLIGDRAVPLLATLFLLSYTKLLRTVTTIIEFGVLDLIHYPDESMKIIVWYSDGSLPYCQHPHIYLFIAAMVTLFICLSFTLFLFLIQCWRRISHLRLLRWINKFTPFYDAYFAPLKDKHHYWFGTLLLVRIALLVSFTATSSTLPFISLLILQSTSVVLLFYTSIRHVYKSKLVRTLESASLLNLIILIGFTLHTGGREIAFLEVSIAFAFAQFTVIVIISLIKVIFNMRYKCMRRNGYHLIRQDVDSSDEMVHESVEDPEIREQNVHNLRNTVDTY